MEEDAPNPHGQAAAGSFDMIDSSSEEENDEATEIRRRAARAMAVNFIAQHAPFNPMEAEFIASSSSDEERQWGGSIPGKAPNKARNFAQAKETLIRQYFSGEASTFDEKDFERRFRMPRVVFMRVKDAVLGEEPFTEKSDAYGKPGIDPLVRLSACFRKLALVLPVTTLMRSLRSQNLYSIETFLSCAKL